jgi:glycolate oxidase subunit GlcD
VDQLVEQLHSVVGTEGVISEHDELLVYDCDGLTQHKYLPRAVVFPRSTDEVREIIKLLVREEIPFAPRGAGTGLSGGALAYNRAVIIEMARMRRLLKIDPKNRYAIAETGLVNLQLSREAIKYGLHYVPDPSSQASCTIGGNIAENSGGIHCLKYGMTVDHVIGVRAVLPNGELVDLGGIGNEGSIYDLLGVFIGSEGTFGIATEATLRLTPVPAGVRTMLADFPKVDYASGAVSAIIAEGLLPAALEMVDGPTIRAIESSVYAIGLPLDVEAILLIELDGLEAGLNTEAARAEAICYQYGARNIRRANNEYERKKLWAARKSAFGAMGRISPDLMIQDATIPRSRLPEVLAETYRIASKYNLIVTNVFHAGDGNLHPVICFDSRNIDQLIRVKEAGRELMETCVRAGGSITGEHGVGLDKSQYLPLIFSEDDMETMLRVRAAFDPTGLCNPGKIFPESRSCGESRAINWKDPNNINSGSHMVPSVMKPGIVSSSKTSTQILSRAHSIDANSIYNKISKVISTDKLLVGGLNGRGLIATPESTKEACEILRLAAAENWTTVPAGALTWINVGDALQNADLVVSTVRLSRVLEHVPADLITIVESGTTLGDLNSQLGIGGQWLPIDPPDDGRATIGGIVATGLPGVQSFGYGAPRNYVIGMRVALSDGRIIKTGGRVVKNVAGYDLGKLFCGSYGTLGLILELTFKLRPIPQQVSSIVFESEDVNKLLSCANEILAPKTSTLLPVAVELLSPGVSYNVELTDKTNLPILIIRFAGMGETVDHQIRECREIGRKISSDIHIDTVLGDSKIWKRIAAMPLQYGDHLVWRINTYPTELANMVNDLKDNGKIFEPMLWHASVGTGQLRVISKPSRVTDAINHLKRTRQRVKDLGGKLVIENAPLEIKEAFGTWDNKDSLFPLMQRIKTQLDPHYRLSPGRINF